MRPLSLAMLTLSACLTLLDEDPFDDDDTYELTVFGVGFGSFDGADVRVSVLDEANGQSIVGGLSRILLGEFEVFLLDALPRGEETFLVGFVDVDGDGRCTLLRDPVFGVPLGFATSDVNVTIDWFDIAGDPRDCNPFGDPL